MVDRKAPGDRKVWVGGRQAQQACGRPVQVGGRGPVHSWWWGCVEDRRRASGSMDYARGPCLS